MLQIAIGFFVIIFGFGQSKYSELVAKAWKQYEAQEYLNSGDTYLTAFKSLREDQEITENIINHRFNAACSYALAGEKEKAFEQLIHISKRGLYTDYNHISKDTDLKSLHSDNRWEMLLLMVKKNHEAVKPLTKPELKSVFSAYLKAQENVYSKGSTVGDADHLYDFYTNDFTYNHPGYGGVYQGKILYNNIVNNIKNGNYANSRKRHMVNIIYGKDAVAVEQRYEGDDKTTMTVYKFRKDKIYYVHEYW